MTAGTYEPRDSGVHGSVGAAAWGGPSKPAPSTAGSAQLKTMALQLENVHEIPGHARVSRGRARAGRLQDDGPSMNNRRVGLAGQPQRRAAAHGPAGRRWVASTWRITSRPERLKEASREGPWPARGSAASARQGPRPTITSTHRRRAQHSRSITLRLRCSSARSRGSNGFEPARRATFDEGGTSTTAHGRVATWAANGGGTVAGAARPSSR